MKHIRINFGSKMRTLVILFLIKCVFGDFSDRTVVTPDGALKGYTMDTRKGRTILAFSGIPYAKPPVGKLRFKDPEPVEKWTGIRNSRDYGQLCPQYLFFINILSNFTLGDEDCLYVSVYTPNIKKRLPVLIYFHGGAFFTGFGELAHSPAYLLDEDMVIITGNYRLGALGFLSLGDDVIPGNFGLKDQLMMIKWAKRNIEYFGGDPNDITLIGESAGAASVHYHLLSPLSQGSFNRAITFSGSALSPWAYIHPNLARERALFLAQSLNCDRTSSEEILECLRTKDAYEIINVRRKLSVWEQPDPITVFTPTIDIGSNQPFLTDDPWNLHTYPVPWIMGIGSIDGYLKTGNFVKYPSDYKTFDRYFNYLGAASMFYHWTSSNPAKISKKIKKFYYGKKPINQNVLEQMTNMFTDSWFFYPTICTARNHTGNVYFYFNNYEGENTFAETFGSKRIFHGSTHTDELIYVWNLNAVFPPLRARDTIQSKTLVTIIYNFMKFNDPSFQNVPFKWPAWNDNEVYLRFDKNVHLGQNLLSKREDFWSRLDFRDLHRNN